ncbi:MAG: hypothetical protein ACQEVT_09780 [Pseudomonadota bacterium]|uniref:hypothetical protein n=1 Tax=Roseovarius TaxID=74030 RepID=UPI0022A83D31|nr:hypothetical protein [Roseovarius sp. EGI FJ00037]MCZ0814130.1 hypothetical protein [Roseovarius sp. EGI FJ00037]
MVHAAEIPKATLGWFGFVTGALALILTIAIFWSGPFAPQQSAAVGLGELAADIAKSAARSVAGQPPPAPVAPTRGIDDYLAVGVGVLAGLAVIIGIASFIRHEPKRVALSGVTLGGFAIGFQLFAWTVMLIAGGLVIAALVFALRDAFGDILGGLFGG